METIEIGLMVIDLETLEVVDEFQRFVRPRLNSIFIDFCKRLHPFNKRTWMASTMRRLAKSWKLSSPDIQMLLAHPGAITMQGSWSAMLD